MKKILALLLACIMLTAVLTGCGNKRASTETAAQPATAEQTDATASDGATYTLKLAHDANTTSAYQLSALELKRMIEEKSDGRIKVEVYPARTYNPTYNKVFPIPERAFTGTENLTQNKGY